MQNASEQQIKMAAKLYGARDAMLSLFGRDKFNDRVKEYRPYVEAIAANSKGGNILASGIELASRLSKGRGSAVHVAMALATAVEMIEPS